MFLYLWPLNLMFMKRLNEFLIPFVGLKEGKHQFDFQIDKKFFDAFEFDEYEDASIAVTVILEKKITLMQLHFSCKGAVTVPSDATGEDIDLPIEGQFNIIVKFGQEFDDSHDEILILPQEAYQLDLKQYIYELIVLSVPLRRVMPDESELESEEEYLEEEKNYEQDVDPRWDQLKKLLDKK